MNGIRNKCAQSYLELIGRFGQVLRIPSLYFYSSGFLLLLTGLLKLISVQDDVAYLKEPDPLFYFLSIRQILTVSSVLEIGIGMLLFVTTNCWIKVFAAIWFSILVLTYRIGLYVIGYNGPCQCLGGAGQWLHLSRHTIDVIMKSILAYLLVGSLALALYYWRETVCCPAKINNSNTTID